ncbi:MAG: LysR substrate-binding domain-containing protein [Pseudomonadota bacterium]
MRREIPSTSALICFEAAAQAESFARAAEVMNLSQSAISRHVAALETYLGEPLFIRRRQRVALSTAGRQFLNEISPLLDAMETAVLRTRQSSDPTGLVTIGVYPTLGTRWLMPILSEDRSRSEKVTINITTYLSNDEVDPDAFDLGIVQGDPPWHGFQADPLMPESLVAVASPRLLPDPVGDPQDLLKMRVLKHVSRPLSWPIWFGSQGRTLHNVPPGPSFSQFEMLIDAVRRGQGVAIIPRILVEAELAKGAVVLAHSHVSDAGSGYFLITPHAKMGLPRVRRLRGILLEAGEQDRHVVQVETVQAAAPF